MNQAPRGAKTERQPSVCRTDPQEKECSGSVTCRGPNARDTVAFELSTDVLYIFNAEQASVPDTQLYLV